MQDKLTTETSQKAALEHMLQEEKHLMESVVRREMEKAASLQVDLATARQQKALSRQLMRCGCTCGHSWRPLQPVVMPSPIGAALREGMRHMISSACCVGRHASVRQISEPQGEAQAAKERAEARLAEAERTARRQHEELDSRAARLEAQLHQQALDNDDYRRRSEAEIRRQQQLIAMAEQATR